MLFILKNVFASRGTLPFSRSPFATMKNQSQPIQSLLNQAVQKQASDLHYIVGHPPVLRIHGQLKTLDEDVLTQDVVEEQLASLCSPEILQRFRETHNVDFALQLPIDNVQRRFRVNYFTSSGNCGACFRVIPNEIPDLEWTGFSYQLADKLTGFRNGLVLIAGVTGAGKTTTLAMLIDMLNQKGGHRIITIEEPIEYLHARYKNSVVTQREVGTDVQSFADGLKYGLRQDPDIILVGEIRDRATAQLALSAAETGHLVFSTLHTRDSKGAVCRITDLFPEGIQSEVRSQLSLSLRAVVSQHLIPGVDEGSKRELAMEVMINNSPIASGIRMGKFETIDNNIQTGRSAGMQSLDDAILDLWKRRKISRQSAEKFLTNQDLLIGW